MLLEVADELLSDDSFDDLGYERQVGYNFGEFWGKLGFMPFSVRHP